MNDQGGKQEKEWELRKEDIRFWYERGIDGIITEYVRSKVAGLLWERVGYIDDLMDIEMYCVRGARHFAEGMRFHLLRQDYPEEYQAIRAELDPSWPARNAELQDRKKAEEKARQKRKMEEGERAREQLARDREAWMKLDGKR
jgi:hypothetical protein